MTPFGDANMPWKLSPERDLLIVVANMGEIITFNNRTPIGSASMQIRLNMSIKEGATITGQVRSDRAEDFPFHLTIPLESP